MAFPGAPNRANGENTYIEYQVRSSVSFYCPPAVVAQSKVDAKTGEECRADGTNFPEPAEEYGPGHGDKEHQETR